MSGSPLNSLQIHIVLPPWESVWNICKDTLSDPDSCWEQCLLGQSTANDELNRRSRPHRLRKHYEVCQLLGYYKHTRPCAKLEHVGLLSEQYSLKTFENEVTYYVNKPLSDPFLPVLVYGFGW